MAIPKRTAGVSCLRSNVSRSRGTANIGVRMIVARLIARSSRSHAFPNLIRRKATAKVTMATSATVLTQPAKSNVPQASSAMKNVLAVAHSECYWRCGPRRTPRGKGPQQGGPPRGAAEAAQRACPLAVRLDQRAVCVSESHFRMSLRTVR